MQFDTIDGMFRKTRSRLNVYAGCLLAIGTAALLIWQRTPKVEPPIREGTSQQTDSASENERYIRDLLGVVEAGIPQERTDALHEFERLRHGGLIASMAGGQLIKEAAHAVSNALFDNDAKVRTAAALAIGLFTDLPVWDSLDNPTKRTLMDRLLKALPGSRDMFRINIIGDIHAIAFNSYFNPLPSDKAPPAFGRDDLRKQVRVLMGELGKPGMSADNPDNLARDGPDTYKAIMMIFQLMQPLRHDQPLLEEVCANIKLVADTHADKEVRETAAWVLHVLAMYKQ